MAAPYPQQQPYPQQPQYYAPAGPAPVQRTSLPLAGGILLLIVGVIGLISAVWVMALGGDIGSLVGGVIPGLGEIVIILGLIGLVFSLLVIMGGYFAIQRKHFGLAIVGAVFSLLVGAIPWLFPAILALIGLILIAVAHKEFE